VGIHKCMFPGFLVGDKVCIDADDMHSIGGVGFLCLLLGLLIWPKDINLPST
jgi:hypothetical protein